MLTIEKRSVRLSYSTRGERRLLPAPVYTYSTHKRAIDRRRSGLFTLLCFVFSAPLVIFFSVVQCTGTHGGSYQLRQE